ncbi:hypothetical protein [Crateriforma conspicua]|uniref:hypothetical protein n=1 Tax=Crateriforma conspicua TaxID=2527996 RepID=UPI0011891243|nr:hypothetical protein [Crateriforma conspicua]QDV65062.1 ABC-2 family transporter protein [Crateriforma conspicua]
MALHDVGYRGWNQSKTNRITRPLAIARSGVSLVLRAKWLRFGLMLGWLPVIFPAAIIFMFEYTTQQEPDRVVGLLMSPPIDRPDLAAEYMTDPAAVRHEIWSSAILAFFRYPQLYAMVILVGLITPRLVCYDMRSRAYLQYFARPLTPTEYVFGKSAVLWFFLACIVTVPALVLYVTGVLFSPGLMVVAETWDIPLRVMVASLCLILPTTTLAMVYSSLTPESRYATFAWFATWVLGYVAYTFLTFAPGVGRPPRRRFGGRGGPSMSDVSDWIDLDRWRLVSPYHMLGKVQSWVFDVQDTDGSVWPSIAVLVAMTVVGTWIIRNRILSRLRV